MIFLQKDYGRNLADGLSAIIGPRPCGGHHYTLNERSNERVRKVYGQITPDHLLATNSANLAALAICFAYTLVYLYSRGRYLVCLVQARKHEDRGYESARYRKTRDAAQLAN
jgi:hypothetical protein